MTTATRTRAESRILRALELLDRLAVEDYANAPDVTATRFLHGRRNIFQASAVVGTGRRSSERDLSAALARLVASGAIEEKVTSGMGGGLRSYIRTAKGEQ